MRAARRALEAEVSPIDDIRSTRLYRIRIAGNLLEEFLRGLFERRENELLARWNLLNAEDATGEVLPCCGSQEWARTMAGGRPYADVDSLFARASEAWRELNQKDWLEAFRSHPRIGEQQAETPSTAVSAEWSEGEQRNIQTAGEDVKRAIAEGNRRYEDHFGRIFIICARGKQPAAILEALQRRLRNDDVTEMRESAAEQEKIMQLRLRKWLAQEEI